MSLDLHQAPPSDDNDSDILRERRRRVDLYRRAKKDKRFAAYLYKRASQDPVFWFENFAWTKVKWRTEKQRRLHRTSVVPAMNWPILQDAMGLFLGLTEDDRTAEDELFAVSVAASREVGKTKNPCLWAVWDWQFGDGSYGFISRRERDVDNNKSHGDGSIFSFIRWAIRQQPEWMRPPSFKLQKRSRNDDNWLEIVNPVNGNSLVGSSTTVDAMRGDRRKRVVVDEAVLMADFEGLLESLDDVGPVWACSSVRGRGNGFARCWHGELGFDVWDYGAHIGQRGWVRLRWHYSDRPDRRPGTAQGDAWIRATKARKTPLAWAQEQEVSWDASLPLRIWKTFSADQHVFDGEEWRREVAPYLSSATIVEGWDFGSGEALTAVVWIAHIQSIDTIYVLDYRQFREATDKQVAAGVADAGYACNRSPGGRMPDRRAGDIAGKAGGERMVGGRMQAPRRSWIRNLGDQGIRIAGVRLDDAEAIQRVDIGLRGWPDGEETDWSPRIYFSPLCSIRHDRTLPSLTECVSQYHRKETEGVDHPKPDKDIHSHAADALKHAVWEVWKRTRVRMGH
jgi:hypothetical protein